MERNFMREDGDKGIGNEGRTFVRMNYEIFWNATDKRFRNMMG
jgi:hypothetical protein